MLSMISRIFLVGALCLTSCVDPPFSIEEQAQIDPGTRAWREVTISSEEGEWLAKVFVIGDESYGEYKANTEYWWVRRDHSSGEMDFFKSHGSQMFVGGGLYLTTAEHDTEPSYPIDEFSGAKLQTFTQPVYPVGGWGSGFTQDTIQGGTLFVSDSGVGLRIFSHKGSISRLVWYQTISQDEIPQNVIPEGFFEEVFFFPIAEGQLGYAIDLKVQ
jgi:hypothetical protein